MGGRKPEPVAPRLLARVASFDGCWTLGGRPASNGYGQISVNNRTESTHVAAFEVWKGPVPAGLVVMHTCDNRMCVNPDHLIVGTQAQNIADKVARNRQAKGSRHGNAKLTEADAAYIRKTSAEAPSRIGVVPSLARKLGVSEFAIRRVIRGEGWRHVGVES
jgi:hypothetical protein